MENDYNDNDNLIVNLQQRNEYKNYPNIKFCFGLSIVLCILAYILLDVNMIVSYESLDNHNQTLPVQYKYIYVYDLVYAAWYLAIYIYIASNYNKNITCVYFLIPIVFLANIIIHIVSYVIITNELKKNKMTMHDGVENFVYYCISVIFNCIMLFLYIKYVSY